jgi:hypothetical protein
MTFRDVVSMLKALRYSREVWSSKEALLGRDRRSFYRLPVHASCRLNSQLFGLESVATVVNLSLGGVGLEAPIQWPEGSQMRIRFDEYGLEIEGVICFRVEEKTGTRYGVKFQKLGLRALMQVRRILRERYEGPLSA